MASTYLNAARLVLDVFRVYSLGCFPLYSLHTYYIHTTRSSASRGRFELSHTHTGTAQLQRAALRRAAFTCRPRVIKMSLKITKNKNKTGGQFRGNALIDERDLDHLGVKLNLKTIKG